MRKRQKSVKKSGSKTPKSRLPKLSKESKFLKIYNSGSKIPSPTQNPEDYPLDKGIYYNPKRGLLYYGEFANDRFEGIGFLQTPKKSIFSEFDKNSQTGLGRVYEEAEKRIFTGKFIRNRKNGIGLLRDFGRGLTKKGFFERGLLNGFGVLSVENTTAKTQQLEFKFGPLKFVFSRKNSQKSKSLEKLATTLHNKSYVYKGYFSGGEIHGVGSEVSFQPGEPLRKTQYIGQFKNGHRYGVGLFLETKYNYLPKDATASLLDVSAEQILMDFNSGKQKALKSYVLAQWKKGARKGFCVEKYENGDQFEGLIAGNRFNGVGKYLQTVQDGGSGSVRYTGMFSNGRKEGLGKLEDGESGAVFYLGEWEGDQKSGFGYQLMVSPQMSQSHSRSLRSQKMTYFGQFHGDKRNGFGTKRDSKSVYRGEWKNGKPHGYGIIQLTDGSREVKAGVWRAGKLTRYLEESHPGFENDLEHVNRVEEQIEAIELKSWLKEKRAQIRAMEEDILEEKYRLEDKFKQIEVDFESKEATLDERLEKIRSSVNNLEEDVTDTVLGVRDMLMDDGVEIFGKDDFLKPKKMTHFGDKDDGFAVGSRGGSRSRGSVSNPREPSLGSSGARSGSGSPLRGKSRTPPTRKKSVSRGPEGRKRGLSRSRDKRRRSRSGQKAPTRPRQPKRLLSKTAKSRSPKQRRDPKEGLYDRILDGMIGLKGSPADSDDYEFHDGVNKITQKNSKNLKSRPKKSQKGLQPTSFRDFDPSGAAQIDDYSSPDYMTRNRSKSKKRRKTRTSSKRRGSKSPKNPNRSPDRSLSKSKKTGYSPDRTSVSNAKKLTPSRIGGSDARSSTGHSEKYENIRNILKRAKTAQKSSQEGSESLQPSNNPRSSHGDNLFTTNDFQDSFGIPRSRQRTESSREKLYKEIFELEALKARINQKKRELRLKKQEIDSPDKVEVEHDIDMEVSKLKEEIERLRKEQDRVTAETHEVHLSKLPAPAKALRNRGAHNNPDRFHLERRDVYLLEAKREEDRNTERVNKERRKLERKYSPLKKKLALIGSKVSSEQEKEKLLDKRKADLERQIEEFDQTKPDYLNVNEKREMLDLELEAARADLDALKVRFWKLREESKLKKTEAERLRAQVREFESQLEKNIQESKSGPGANANNLLSYQELLNAEPNTLGVHQLKKLLKLREEDNSELRAEVKKNTDKIQKITSEKDKNFAKIKEARDEVDELNRESGKVEDKLAKLEAEEAALNKTILQNETMLDALKSKFRDCKKDILDIEGDIKDFEAEQLRKEQLARSGITNKERLNLLQGEIRDREEAANELKKKQEKLKAQEEEIQAKASAFRDKIDELRDWRSKLNDKEMELRRLWDEVKHKKRRMEENKALAEVEHAKSLDSYKSMNKRIAQLDEYIQEAAANLEKLKNRRKDLEKLENDTKQNEKYMAEDKAEIERLAQDNAKKQAEIEKTKKLSNEVLTKLADLKAQKEHVSQPEAKQILEDQLEAKVKERELKEKNKSLLQEQFDFKEQQDERERKSQLELIEKNIDNAKREFQQRLTVYDQKQEALKSLQSKLEREVLEVEQEERQFDQDYLKLQSDKGQVEKSMEDFEKKRRRTREEFDHRYDSVMKDVDDNRKVLLEIKAKREAGKDMVDEEIRMKIKMQQVLDQLKQDAMEAKDRNQTAEKEWQFEKGLLEQEVAELRKLVEFEQKKIDHLNQKALGDGLSQEELSLLDVSEEDTLELPAFSKMVPELKLKGIKHLDDGDIESVSSTVRLPGDLRLLDGQEVQERHQQDHDQVLSERDLRGSRPLREEKDRGVGVSGLKSSRLRGENGEGRVGAAEEDLDKFLEGEAEERVSAGLEDTERTERTEGDRLGVDSIPDDRGGGKLRAKTAQKKNRQDGSDGPQKNQGRSRSERRSLLRAKFKSVRNLAALSQFGASFSNKKLKKKKQNELSHIFTTEKFFEKHEPPRTFLELKQVSVMALGRRGRRMYLGGVCGLWIVNCGQNGDHQVLDYEEKIKPLQLKVLPNGILVVFNLESNALEAYSASLKQIPLQKALNLKKAPSKDSLKSQGPELEFYLNRRKTKLVRSGFTADHFHFFWLQNRLTVVDFNLRKSKKYSLDNFWFIEYKDLGLSPVFMLADKKGGKCFGVGQDMKDYIKLVFYSRKLKSKSIIPPTSFTDSIDKWVCGEVSFDQKSIIIGGSYHKTPVLGSLEFTADLHNNTFITLPVDKGAVEIVKRIPGVDIYLSGCFGAIVATVFEAKFKRMKVLRVIKGVLEGKSVYNLAYFGNHCYFVGERGEEVGCVEFFKNPEMDKYYKHETEWAGDEAGVGRAPGGDNKAEDRQKEPFQSGSKSLRQELQEDEDYEENVFDDQGDLVKSLNSANRSEIDVINREICSLAFSSENRDGLLLCHNRGINILNLGPTQDQTTESNLTELVCDSSYYIHGLIIAHQSCIKRNGLKIFKPIQTGGGRLSESTSLTFLKKFELKGQVYGIPQLRGLYRNKRYLRKLSRSQRAKIDKNQNKPISYAAHTISSKSVVLVNLSNLKTNEIDDFWVGNGRFANTNFHPISTILGLKEQHLATKSPGKQWKEALDWALGLAAFQNLSMFAIFKLEFLNDGSTEKHIYWIDEFFSNDVKMVSSFEKSNFEDQVVIAGLHRESGGKKSDPMITKVHSMLLGSGGKLKVAAEVSIPDESFGMVYCLKMYQKSQFLSLERMTEFFFLAGNQDLYILTHDINGLRITHRFEKVFNEPITSVAFDGSTKLFAAPLKNPKIVQFDLGKVSKPKRNPILALRSKVRKISNLNSMLNLVKNVSLKSARSLMSNQLEPYTNHRIKKIKFSAQNRLKPRMSSLCWNLVDFSHDGSKLFIQRSRSFFRVTDLFKQELEPAELVGSDIGPFLNLKVEKDSDVSTQEINSLDFVVFSQAMTELTRLKVSELANTSKTGSYLNFQKMIKMDDSGLPGATQLLHLLLNRASFSCSEDYQLWIPGNGDLCKVDNISYGMRRFEGFFDFEELGGDEMQLIHCVVADEAAERVIAVTGIVKIGEDFSGFGTNLEVEQDIVYGVFKQGTQRRKWRSHLIDKIPTVDIALCMDVSLNSDVVFLGGSTEMGFRNEGKAAITAFTFDKKMKITAHVELDDMNLVSCIARFPVCMDSKERIAIAGFDCVMVLIYEVDKFLVSNKISGFFGGSKLVTCLKLCSSSRYMAVCTHEEEDCVRLVEWLN